MCAALNGIFVAFAQNDNKAFGVTCQIVHHIYQPTTHTFYRGQSNINVSSLKPKACTPASVLCRVPPFQCNPFKCVFESFSYRQHCQ